MRGLIWGLEVAGNLIIQGSKQMRKSTRADAYKVKHVCSCSYLLSTTYHSEVYLDSEAKLNLSSA